MTEQQASSPRKSVLITGAAGYVGSLFTQALAAEPGSFETIIATDIRDVPRQEQAEGVQYLTMDIRSEEVSEIITANEVDTIVHLAAIIQPGKDMSMSFLYDVEVGGTKNLMEAAIQHGVKKFVTTSSGASYGYHADNPSLLTEEHPLRGNKTFPYAYHKRLVEALLTEYRETHPEIEQLIFRPGAILGSSVSNPITDLFEKPFVVGIQGSTTPFQFIWDEDVIHCLLQGVHGEQTGIFNLSGDGILTMREIAKILQKPYIAIPPNMLGKALDWMQSSSFTQYGPEQIDFLRYRPVLSNQALHDTFGYRLKKSTREVFAYYLKHRAPLKTPALLQKVRGWLQKDDNGVKNVVITGGASGIGYALAKRFVKSGARVALLDLDDGGLTRAKRTLRGLGPEVMTVPCDVCDANACQEAMLRIIDAWGGVDVLINNAGISHRSLLSQTDPGVIRKVMEVNFFGAVHCTRAALESIIERKGTIVSLSSIAGFAPLIGRTGYAASKHALHGFFDSLRTELSDSGVNVLLVCPSFTDTNIEKNALGGDGSKVRSKRDAVGRMASPEDVAQEIHQAIKLRKKLLVLSPVGKTSYWLNRLVPDLYARVMKATQQGEFRH